jgi:hypothetical protein
MSNDLVYLPSLFLRALGRHQSSSFAILVFLVFILSLPFPFHNYLTALCLNMPVLCLSQFIFPFSPCHYIVLKREHCMLLTIPLPSYGVL